MAAGTFVVFKRAKGNLGKAAINLSTGNYYMSLHKTSASANLVGDVSTFASVGSEISATGGYTAGGKVLSGLAWTTAASVGQWKLDFTDKIFTASGAALNNVRYAVIRNSGTSVGASKVVAYCALTGTQFNLASGSTLTVQFAANGVFTLA